MNKKKITENERKTYEFIRKRIQEGYPPSVREICAHCGFKSTSTAHRAINSLTDKGYLEKASNLNRAIRLKGQAGVKIPLISSVAEGMPLTAAENIDSYIDFTPDKAVKGELFAVKAVGDSLSNSAILDGDIVIFEYAAAVKAGAVAAMLEGSSISVGQCTAESGSVEKDRIGQGAAVGRAIAVLRYFG